MTNRQDGRRRAAAGVGAAVALALLAACGGGGGAESTPTSPSGLYQQVVFTEAQLSSVLDEAYTTRPNWNQIQYTAQSTAAEEIRQTTLTPRLDVWMPPNATATSPQPAIVWIHGGAFRGGGKDEVVSQVQTYARAGYVGVSINYRLTADNDTSPELRWVAQRDAAEDLANAIRYLKLNAARFHIDTTRMATVGTSAGGALSLVNAMDADTLPETVSDHPGTSAQVQAAVSTGATLIDSYYDSIARISFDATDTPVLLLHANPTDSTTAATWTGNVLPTQARITASGNSCQLVPQADMTHTVDLSVGSRFWPAVYPFLKERLRLAALGAP